MLQVKNLEDDNDSLRSDIEKYQRKMFELTRDNNLLKQRNMPSYYHMTSSSSPFIVRCMLTIPII